MSKINNELKNDPLMPVRHTSEHVLQAAMQELYPDLLKVMGPPIENGFYFDFDLDYKVTPEDLPAIEQKMAEIVQKNLPLVKKEVNIQEAREIFRVNPYKQELLDEIESKNEKVTIYTIMDESGNDYDLDLCAGPHVTSTGDVKAFKLLSIAGAYWRGDENNKMLQRIYGTAFNSQEELNEYLNNLEEAKKRDHRKLSQDLDLIVFSDLVGSGLPLYTPKGSLVRGLIYNYSRELNKKIGYEETALPSVNRGQLFKVSGHYDKYKDDMFTVHSHYTEEEYFLKPMNCPQHCVIFGSKTRSYRDLPIRYSDFSVLYRDEKPGEINGLLRTRSFTQDDGHCFCTEDQIEEEFENVMTVVLEALKTYGFEDYWVRISLRDPVNKEKYLGDDAVWDKAETKLKGIAKRKPDINFKEGLGEAAIYGPKLDFMIRDALGREWQISTIQLDMIMPGRFGLKFTDKDGSEKTPFMIHRAIIGSERFMAILLEQYAGALPVWLSPVQAVIIPISEKHVGYASKLQAEMTEKGIRTEIDARNESMQSKIRTAQGLKVPYMLVVGDREEAEGSASVRLRTNENLGSKPVDEIIDRISNKYLTKATDLW
jgi:threonyl-tRNA synthetase